MTNSRRYSRNRNRIHLEAEVFEVRVWAWRIYERELVGVYVPRLGGWA